MDAMIITTWLKIINNCQMEDTQKYLNGILEKRMGSVPSFSKYNGSITRIPKQEENIESMPTLFKKKHETVYKAPTIYESQYKSTNMNESKLKSKKKTENQRVQYMMISKRISSKEDEVVTPAIDVSKYRKTGMSKSPPVKSNQYFMSIARSKKERVQEAERIQQKVERRESQSGRKRKMIFALSREKK